MLFADTPDKLGLDGSTLLSGLFGALIGAFEGR